MSDETAEQRRTAQVRKEYEAFQNDPQAHAQQQLDWAWEQKLIADAPFDDGYDYSTGFKEPRFKMTCHFVCGDHV